MHNCRIERAAADDRHKCVTAVHICAIAGGRGAIRQKRTSPAGSEPLAHRCRSTERRGDPRRQVARQRPRAFGFINRRERSTGANVCSSTRPNWRGGAKASITTSIPLP